MTKDYCSSWPDGEYGYCCKAHDEDYERGGNWKDRMKADAKLRRCIRASFKPEKSTGWFKKSWQWVRGEVMAWTMWSGVRVAGWTPRHFKRGKIAELREWK